MFLHSESWTKPHTAPSAFTRTRTRTAKPLKGHISAPSACWVGDTSRLPKEGSCEAFPYSSLPQVLFFLKRTTIDLSFAYVVPHPRRGNPALQNLDYLNQHHQQKQTGGNTFYSLWSFQHTYFITYSVGKHLKKGEIPKDKWWKISFKGTNHLVNSWRSAWMSYSLPIPLGLLFNELVHKNIPCFPCWIVGNGSNQKPSLRMAQN